MLLLIMTLEIIDNFGSVRDSDHGLVNGSAAREWYSIHPDDPLSATARTHWSTENSRGSWSVRTETYASIRNESRRYQLEIFLLTRSLQNIFYLHLKANLYLYYVVYCYILTQDYPNQLNKA